MKVHATWVRVGSDYERSNCSLVLVASACRLAGAWSSEPGVCFRGASLSFTFIFILFLEELNAE